MKGKKYEENVVLCLKNDKLRDKTREKFYATKYVSKRT